MSDDVIDAVSEGDAVDERALSKVEERGPGAVVRSWWTIGAVGVLGAAVWLGMQMRDVEPSGQPADVWLVELDASLAGATSPGERLTKLRQAMLAPAPGVELELLQRDRSTVAALRAAVDEVAGEVLEAGWAATCAWLQDPVTWPGVARWESERLSPLLRERVGIGAAQLPVNVALPRLDQLRAAVASQVRERDAGLLRRFEEHLAAAIPVRSDERVRAGDFAGAERLWREAAASFFDGVRAPLAERLDDGLAQQVRDRHALAGQRARPAVDAAEAAVADAVRADAEELVRSIREQLAAGLEPERVAQALQLGQAALLQVWPGPR